MRHLPGYLEGAVDLQHRLCVQRVEDLGAVDGEAEDAVRDGDFDVLVVHDHFLSIGTGFPDA